MLRRVAIRCARVACGVQRQGRFAGARTGRARGAGLGGGAPRCEPLPFAESTPVPEASGAAWLTIDGQLRLVVAGDSGNHGAYGMIDPETGATVEQGKLPLERRRPTTSRASRPAAITCSASPRRAGSSSGSASRRASSSSDGPTRSGPSICPERRARRQAAAGRRHGVRRHQSSNCGRNYEGLCLTEHRRLRRPRQGRRPPLLRSSATRELRVERDRRDRGRRPGPPRRLRVSTSTARCGSATTCSGCRRSRASITARPEVAPIAVARHGLSRGPRRPGDVFYRMSDTGGSPSLMGKFRCKPSAR